jgi:hypothetical protein
MTDVSRAPDPPKFAPVLEATTIPTLDGWIESLMQCKQLAEVDVQRLCEKVCIRRGSSPHEREEKCRVMDSERECTLTTRPGKRSSSGRVQRAASCKRASQGPCA